MKQVHFSFELSTGCTSVDVYSWITNWHNHAGLYKPNKSVKILEGDGGIGTIFEIHSRFMFVKNVETYKVSNLEFKEWPHPHLVIEKHSVGGIYKCQDKITIKSMANGCILNFEMTSDVPKGIMTWLYPITKWLAYRQILSGWKNAFKKIAQSKS